MKTSSWFEAFALLVICLISAAVGLATDGVRVDSARALEVAAKNTP
jgi:hypothetical protein